MSGNKRPRIERRRVVPQPGTRLRRDPRAERQPPVASAAEEPSPTGRIRRDPRAARVPAKPAPAMNQPTAQPAPRTIIIDDPACLILAVPDFEDGRLSSHDRDLLGAARMLADAAKGALVVLMPSTSKEDIATAGADRTIAADISGYAPEARAALVLACIETLRPRHVLFCETATGGGDVGRRVGAALGELPAPHVIRLSASEAASRGNGGRSDYLQPPPRLLFVAAETADPPAEARREARSLPPPALSSLKLRIEDRGIAATDPNAVPLTEADFIVSAGNGVTDWPGFHDVAAALGAAEGGSRVVCDTGLLPRERQVGASGSLVEPRCYLAFGIAGAPQHLQGILRCERVLAVNTDLHAEMVKRADLAIIADAQAVMPALARLAKDRRLGS